MNKQYNTTLEFIKDRHNGQVRRYTGEPYYNHCIRVAETVKNVTDNEEVIVAALLHDILEDTDTGYEELVQFFGNNVANLVLEVTNVGLKTDSRTVRKQAEVEHLSKASHGAKIIKLADILDNLPSIIEHNPEFAKTYIAEKEAVWDVIYDGSDELSHELGRLFIEYYKNN